MPSPWGQALGGISEFLKLQRGLEQDTENRSQQKQTFESGLARDRAVTEGARLSNQEAERRIARQPNVDRDADFDAAIRRMGGIQNLTDEHFASWAGDDPTRLAQVPGLKKSAAESAARIKVQDQRDANAGKLVDLQTQSATLALPGQQAAAGANATAWEYIKANPKGDPLTDNRLAQARETVGLPNTMTAQQRQQYALQLAEAGRNRPGDFIAAQEAADERKLAKTLPPGVTVRDASVFDVLAAPLVANIENSLKSIDALQKDVSGPPGSGIIQPTGQGDSYAEKVQREQAQRLSMSLYKEADDVIWQLQKNGVTDSRAIGYARQRLRHYLARVPKYWKNDKGQIVSEATANLPTVGSGVSGQGP